MNATTTDPEVTTFANDWGLPYASAMKHVTRRRRRASAARDHMTPWCPHSNFTPHPEYAHLCNCNDCTARADAIDIKWPPAFARPRQVTRTTFPAGATPTGRAPDPDMWTAARVNIPEIGAAAGRRLGLDSPSEHDLSLATRLAALDWTPQDIANVLLWNRRRRGEDTKYPGYYLRTVDRAVTSAATWKDRP